MMAILCKYPEGSNPPEVIVRILKKLEILDAWERSKLIKHLLHLKVIAQLRNLQDETNHQIEINMPKSFYDVTKDPAFKKGIQEGTEKITRLAIERLLLKQILSDFDISEALDAPLALVESIKEELIQSGRLKE